MEPVNITYEDLEKVNKGIKKIDIKGKPYAMVAARVQAFRKLYPNGKIDIKATERPARVTFNEEGKEIRRQRVMLCEAIIYPSYTCDAEAFLAKNIAEEIEGTTTINTGSFIENCATSAVGRALALCGIGSADDIASAEEVINVQGYERISKEKAEALRQYVEEKKGNKDYILKFHKVKSFEEMTVRQYAEVIKYLERGGSKR